MGRARLPTLHARWLACARNFTHRPHARALVLGRKSSMSRKDPRRHHRGRGAGTRERAAARARARRRQGREGNVPI
eukprot:2819430-Alexandrium_andersonii.AAC.1